MSKIVENARVLEQELAWFRLVLETRFKHYFGQEDGGGVTFDVQEVSPPDLRGSSSEYAQFAKELPVVERLALMLALVPHVRPRLLDVFFSRDPALERRFTEFGGIQPRFDGEFVPTGETLAFILGGEDLALRFLAQRIYERGHVFAVSGVLKRGANGTPVMKAPLHISEEHLSLFTTGERWSPCFSADFPAERIETALTWEDVVLHPNTHTHLAEIQAWIEHGEALMRDWGMSGKLRPGYRSLFYGPPGTGKTMTACLLGKSTGREIYRIDLSLVLSKYIGETEKNLGRVFDYAQSRQWILFFDEADALFGRRTETRDARDRYANQEVSFLLQRIETFDGIVILATNLRDNLDEALLRRFESVIYFPMPRPEERVRLWRQGLPLRARLDASVDLEAIASTHPFSGGAIMNIILYASLQALKEGGRALTADDLLQGIRREYAKSGK